MLKWVLWKKIIFFQWFENLHYLSVPIAEQFLEKLFTTIQSSCLLIWWWIIHYLWELTKQDRNLWLVLSVRKIFFALTLHFQAGLFKTFNPFHATRLFRYLLKTSENQRFSDVFRGYQLRPVEWNELLDQTCLPLL